MNLKANNYISEKEYKFLSKHFHSFRRPICYRLAKIHKFFENSPPLRPIEYVDSLKYQAKTCKSYIRDTSDFLMKLKSLLYYQLPSQSLWTSIAFTLISITRRVLMPTTKNWKHAKTKLFHQTLIYKPYILPSFQNPHTLTSTLTQNLVTLNI